MPQLVEVVLIGIGILAPTASKAIGINQFLEGLLQHFFSEYRSHYQPVDCKWFIELANRMCNIPSTTIEFLLSHQVTFAESDAESLTGCLSWNVHKFYLSRILVDSSSHDGAPALLHKTEVFGNFLSTSEPQGSHRNWVISQLINLPHIQVRIKIGTILTSDPSLGAPGPYIPECYHQFIPRAILPEVNLVSGNVFLHEYISLSSIQLCMSGLLLSCRNVTD